MGKTQLSKEQKSRLLIGVQDQIDELAAINRERIAYVNRLGLGVHEPLVHLSAMVQALIGWVAPTDYQRARIMLDVERFVEDALSDENVGIAKAQIDKAQEERERMAREMALAEQGRRESGLYVPESAAADVVVPGATPPLSVVPEPTTKSAEGAIAPPPRP